MKKQVFLISSLIFAAFFISCSKVKNEEMTVVKDCTGSYLRFNNKDYLICNFEIVENFNNGDEVEASFRKIDECKDDKARCALFHDNEGWIKVTKIK